MVALLLLAGCSGEPQPSTEPAFEQALSLDWVPLDNNTTGSLLLRIPADAAVAGFHMPNGWARAPPGDGGNSLMLTMQVFDADGHHIDGAVVMHGLRDQLVIQALGAGKDATGTDVRRDLSMFVLRDVQAPIPVIAAAPMDGRDRFVSLQLFRDDYIIIPEPAVPMEARLIEAHGTGQEYEIHYVGWVNSATRAVLEEDHTFVVGHAQLDEHIPTWHNEMGVRDHTWTISCDRGGASAVTTAWYPNYGSAGTWSAAVSAGDETYGSTGALSSVAGWDMVVQVLLEAETFPLHQAWSDGEAFGQIRITAAQAPMSDYTYVQAFCADATHETLLGQAADGAVGSAGITGRLAGARAP